MLRRLRWWWFILVLVGALGVGFWRPWHRPTVVIGFVEAMTGTPAEIGLDGRDGTRLAVEEVNARGGVGGLRVELAVQPLGASEDAAEVAISALKAAGAVATIGPMVSGSAMRLVPVAEQKRLVLLSPTVSADALAGKKDHFFRIYPLGSVVARRLAEHLLGRGIKRFAVIFDQGNAAHTANIKANFQRAVEAGGGSIVLSLPYVPTAALSPLAEAVAKSDAEAVLLLASASDAGLITQRLRVLGSPVQIALSQWSSAPAFLNMASAAAEGTIAFTIEPNPRGEQRRAFNEQFERRFGRPAGFAAAQAYEATTLLLGVLAQERASERLPEALLAAPPVKVFDEAISFDEFGDTLRQGRLIVVRGGRFEELL